MDTLVILLRVVLVAGLVTAPVSAFGALASDTPRPAIDKNIEAARQTAPVVKLAPAPTVSRWEPIGGNVDEGIVVIEGQGFDPASVVVRHSGNALTILDKSSTRVVARLGTWSGGSASTGQLIVKNLSSESRVLSQSYPVRPRWPATPPRMMEVRRLAQPQPRLWRTTFESAYALRLLDVPGDEIVGGELIEASGSRCAFVSWRPRIRYGPAAEDVVPDNGINGVSPDRPIPIRDDPETFESGGRGAQELHLREFWIATFQANADALCDIRMRMKVRYRDRPEDVRNVDVLLRGVPSPSMRKRMVVHDTYALLTSKLFEIKWDLLNTPLACGYDNHGDALRFYLNWVPTGSNCEHTLWFNEIAWRHGYDFKGWTWQGPPPLPFDPDRLIPRCRILDYHPKFPRMRSFLGWDGTWEDGPGIDTIRTVIQECVTATTSHAMDRPDEVHSVLYSVELEVPAEATSWRDAILR